MKKLSKILVAIMASLVLVLTPVILVGCNKTETMSSAQVNDLVANAATNFYSNHTRDGKEEFSAITYHWTQASVNRETRPFAYKETAEAEDTVTRDLEFVTTINADYKVAVKKDGENLVAEYTITTTTTNNGYDTNEDGTLKTTTEKTTTVAVFRAVSYVEDEVTKYVLIHESTTTVDGATIQSLPTKEYQTLATANALATEVDALLKQANNNVEDEFFGISGEMLMLYSNFLLAEKTGNDVKITLAMENMTNVHNFAVSRYTNKSTLYFTNNNISKAEAYTYQKSEGRLMESTITFDYANAAEVNTQVNLTGYTAVTNLIVSNSNGAYKQAINELNSLTMGFMD